MSQSSKENQDININMGKMSFDCGVGKRQNNEPLDIKKQSCKAKYTEKKKFKHNNSTRNDRIGSNENIVAMARNNSGINKSRPVHSKQYDSKHTAPSEFYRTRGHMPASKFCINITQNDMDVCRETAIRLNNVRQSITIDPLLANHLSHLAFVSNQYLFDQQRSMFYFHEQKKQAEITKWLSTRTVEERQEYFDRLGGDLQRMSNDQVAPK